VETRPKFSQIQPLERAFAFDLNGEVGGNFEMS
jgi:hypothetical protein